MTPQKGFFEMTVTPLPARKRFQTLWMEKINSVIIH